MISKAELEFLSELHENNNREWFADHKKRFEAHQKVMKEFFTEVGENLGRQDDFQKEVLATFQGMRPFFDYMSEVLRTNLNGENIY